jgi:2-keto-3-deoxy-L-rhamnonate aldolase RhmA
MLAAAGAIAARAQRAGKIPCTLAITAEGGRRARELGFRFIALGSDFLYLSAGANTIVAASKATA